jgi:replicative DNA helicase
MTAPDRRLALVGRAPRVIPCDLDAEESLLGAMMLAKDAIDAGVERCTAADFYKPTHGYVFAAIAELDARGLATDPITVADELRRAGLADSVGGAAALVALQTNTPAVSSASRYAGIVEEMSLLRKLIGVSAEISELGYSLPQDVTAAIDRAETMVFEVAQRRVGDSSVALDDALADAMARLELLADQGNAITGVPTGYVDLDRQLAGLQPSNLVVVGARPGAGKTSFALGAAAHAAMVAQVPVLFCSLEMSTAEITQRLLSGEARVDSARMRTGTLTHPEWERLARAVERLHGAPLVIDDDPTTTVMDIRAKARRMRAKAGLGLVVVDYLQLMATHSARRADNRQVEVSEIARGLKILARELAVPVLALAQLSRNLEARANKRPVLADLRDSGEIEQSGDVVIFLYRDELYNPDSGDRGQAEVIVAKHRNGATGVSRLAFLEAYARFANMALV